MTWKYKQPNKGFFNKTQLKQIESLFKRIIPADHNRGIPGADQTGASNFLNLLLAMDEDTYYEIPVWRKLYPKALASLEKVSMKNFDKPISGLNDNQCNKLLEKLEMGVLEGMPKDINQKIFFRTLWRHCIQGCFSDPVWGGNRNSIMWRWYGYLQEAQNINLGE